jgi:hypothetical protein
MRARLLAVAASAAVLSGCGQATDLSEPTVADGAPAGELTVRFEYAEGSTPPEPEVLLGMGIVLDGGDGPEFCLGGVMQSLPPQCGGPRLVGWAWAEFTGEASVRGTRWTDGVVVRGTYDGDTFTLTGPAVTLEEYDGPLPGGDEERSLDTPCPEPAGGWRTDHPGTMADFERAAAAATRLDGYAGSWVDYLRQPENEADALETANMILNVRVVGDRAAAAAELQRIWPGPLCVSGAERTEAELRRIQHEVSELPGVLTSSAGFDVVDLRVVHDDGALQQQMDERYGEGVVEVDSALVPVSDLR